jgi:hypothetical protein
LVLFSWRRIEFVGGSTKPKDVQRMKNAIPRLSERVVTGVFIGIMMQDEPQRGAEALGQLLGFKLRWQRLKAFSLRECYFLRSRSAIPLDNTTP